MIYFVAGLAALTALGGGLGWVSVTACVTIIGLLLGGGLAASHFQMTKALAKKG